MSSHQHSCLVAQPYLPSGVMLVYHLAATDIFNSLSCFHLHSSMKCLSVWGFIVEGKVFFMQLGLHFF